MQLFSSPPNRNVAPVAIPQDVPVYRVSGSGFYCDDELLTPGTIIQFTDEPNQDMEPLNELAISSMRNFLSKLDNLGRAKADKENTAFISVLDAFDNIYTAPTHSSRKANVLGAKREAPILGNDKRKASRAAKIDVSDVVGIDIVDKTNVGRDAANGTTDSGLNRK